MDIKEKLDLWVEITGVNPNEKVNEYVIRFDRLSRYDIEKMNEQLKDSLEAGNPILTNALLRGFLKRFTDDSKVSFTELLDNGKEIMAKFALVERLYDAVDANEEEKAFFSGIQNALSYYGADICMEDIDPYMVSQVFLCAKKNMASLDRIQLKKGAFDKTAPKLMKDVYLFRNIEEVVNGVLHIKGNCIILCYIHEDVSESSYFCFAFKNGENVYIINDAPAYTHPYQKYLTRCPSRSMKDRILKGGFPYSLTGVDLSDRYHVGDEFCTEDSSEVFLGRFKDMDMEELLFSVFMIQFIQEEFYKKETTLKDLSYTRGMLDTPLLEQSETTLAVYGGFDKLSIAPIEDFAQTNDLEFEEESSFGTEDYYFKDLVERLGSKVDLMALQSMGNDERDSFLLSDKLLPESAEISAYNKEIKLLSFGKNVIGTKEELEYLRKWQLRFNYAKMIDTLAEKEYKETYSKVHDWISQMAHKNCERLVDMALKDELRGEKRVSHSMGWMRTASPKDGEKDVSLTGKTTMSNAPSGIWLYNERFYNLADYKCVLSKEHATICLVVYPYDYRSFMQMFDVTREELPVEIQSWRASVYRFEGNHLLNNYDPMEWAIKDYWGGQNYAIVLPLSKTAYNNRCKQLGVPADKFWLNKDKE